MKTDNINNVTRPKGKPDVTTKRKMNQCASRVSKNFQCIVCDDFGGFPMKVTYLNGCWWVTTPGSTLQPLKDYVGKMGLKFIYLAEVGGKVGALALIKMLGHALENPECEVYKVLRNRVRDLKRLGIELDVKDEELQLELEVFNNEGKPGRQGNYSVICHLADNVCEWVFDIDAFDSKRDAEQWGCYLFDYIEELGVNFTIV